MRKLNNRVLSAISFILVFLFFGCTDDLHSDFFDGNYPKGETMVRMALDFEPFSGAELGTRSAAGNAMSGIDGGLCVLVYDKEGNLMEGFPQEITEQGNKLSIKDVDRTDDDASNGHSAESKTKQASFEIKLPYGEYYIYAVANLVDKSDLTNVPSNSNTMSVLTGVMNEAIKTRDGFLGYKVKWDPFDMNNNREMLGYFTAGEEDEKPFTHKDMNLKTVSVSEAGMNLHAWLRRCASKVTLDFDGSGLLDNVRVYIRKATIHDIASTCALGAVNAVTDEKDLISYNDKTKDLAEDSKEYYRPTADADAIVYSEGEDFQEWKYVANGHPYITDTKGELHRETATGMYLYENMQDDFRDSGDKTHNKAQESDEDGTGTVVGAGERKYDKDGVPLGSYIEVEGYYDMSSNKIVEKGPIRYRFMLGKDVEYDFNVERNYHYKVTLCFKGYGNEVDWHIEYTRESGFEVRDPYYVSYLYNHDSTIRFRYTPPTGKTVTSLDAEIVGNDWWPSGPGAEAATNMDAKNEQTPFDGNEDYANAAFNKHTYTQAEINAIGLISADVNKLTGRQKYLGNGFLSLRATDTDRKVVTLKEVTTANGSCAEAERNKYMNDTYFYGVKVNTQESQKQTDMVDRSRRTYYFDESNDPSNSGREAYTVNEGASGSLIFNLPMFTREKNLVKESGYTGNNPFEAFCRYAYIRLTARLKDESGAVSSESKIIRVEQVKRITNPTGIYRRSGNNEPFHVCLTEKLADNGDTYAPFESDGPWMAEVLGDQNFITLNGRSTISGASNSNIEFNVRFNRMNTDNKVRNAIIRVRYHNYSCVHLIFVRQGYEPQTVVSGGKKWCTFNLVTKDAEAQDPRDEGSLFKFGNIDTPIDVSSNVYSVGAGIAPNQAEFGASATALNIATGFSTYTTGTNWTSFSGNNAGFNASYNIATMNDFQSLYYSADGHTPIQQGFGVLYADGATETQMKTADVCGWYRHESNHEARDKRGMYGVFIYYWDKYDASVSENYHNIFFPIGRSGFGHRRHWDNLGSSTVYRGVLRYACGRSAEFPSSAALYMPLFHDLYKRKGAIYWASQLAEATQSTGNWTTTAIGLDMNFFTFDVNSIDAINVCKNSQFGSGETGYENSRFDACFLRQVAN